MHMADTAAEDCRWVTERLGARVRNGLSRRDTAKVDEHLDQCARCSAVYLELSEVNSNLAGILAPILLGAAASGYLASVGSGTLAAAPWIWRARHFVQGHGVAAAGSTAASALAVTVAIAVITSGSQPRDTAAEPNSLNDKLAVGPHDPSPFPGATSTTGSDHPARPGQSRLSPSKSTTTDARPGSRRDKGPTKAGTTSPGGVAVIDPATASAGPDGPGSSGAPGGQPQTTQGVPSTDSPESSHPTSPTRTTPTRTTPSHTTPTPHDEAAPVDTSIDKYPAPIPLVGPEAVDDHERAAGQALPGHDDGRRTR